MTKMVKCKTCGADIAKSAKVCPHCGAKNRKFPLIPIIIAVVVLFFIVAGQDDTDDSGKASTTRAVTDEQAPAPVSASEQPQDDNLIDCDISNCHVTYVGHEIVTNLSGDKCVAVYFEFTNNADDSKAFLYTVTDKAFQNGVELETSLWHVNDSSHDKSSEIKPGVTITICSAFVLRDEETVVELDVEPWISFSKGPTDTMYLAVT